MRVCPYCGTPLDFTIGRSSVCPKCGKELHSCLCCRFFDESAHYGCRENIDELVTDKSRGNFCDGFSLTDRQINLKTSDRDKAKAALDALFNF